MSTLLSKVGMSLGQSDASPLIVRPVVRWTAEIFGPVRVLASPPLLRVGSTFSGSCEPYQ